MDEGVSVVGADRRRWEPVALDAEELARAIRRLAVEAHVIMNRPEATAGELLALRRRCRRLRRAARGPHRTGVGRRLRSLHRAVDAQLLAALAGVPPRYPTVPSPSPGQRSARRQDRHAMAGPPSHDRRSGR